MEHHVLRVQHNWRCRGRPKPCQARLCVQELVQFVTTCFPEGFSAASLVGGTQHCSRGTS